MLILNALNILKAYIVCVLRSVHCPVYTYPCLVKLCRANTILRPKPIEFTAKQPWMHGQRWFARTLLLSYQKGMRKYNTRSDIVRCFAVSLFREHGYSFGIGRYIPAFLLLKKLLSTQELKPVKCVAYYCQQNFAPMLTLQYLTILLNSLNYYTYLPFHIHISCT